MMLRKNYLATAKRALAAICALALSGCVTPATTYSFGKSHTYLAPKDVIWERAVAFFANQNISVKTIDKASGLIAAERIGVATQGGEPFSEWASCTKSPLSFPVQQTLDMNIFLRQTSVGTSVTVNVHFTEMRRFGNYPPFLVQCNSTGALERSVFDALDLELKG